MDTNTNKKLHWTLKNSTRKNEKYMIVSSKFLNKKYFKGLQKIHFGAKDFEDYTTHKDIKRKERYLKRHNAIKLKDGTKAVDNILSPAWLSRWILWNKPTIQQSLKDIEKRFGIRIIL